MSRTALWLTMLAIVAATFGCEQLDGRNRNRKGNRLFRETKFVDAVAEYEKALKEVNEPTIHYNIALAYSKIFKIGAEPDTQVVIDVKGSFACEQVPKVKYVTKQVCVKSGDKHFEACDAKNVCASSFKCQQTELCTVDNASIAEMAANHFSTWLKAHPKDEDTRALMTQVWIDSSQFKKAIDYWEELLKAKPADPMIMGSLAGINLKANDWRKSIEWYTKVAEVAKDETAKVAAYQFIGNVAWSKLNSKTLTVPESVELADRGIGALQKAAQMQPKNPKFFGLMASIFNFRALAQGGSWAAGVDRASAQDLQGLARVLNAEAKKAQGLPTAPTPTPAPAAPAPAPQGSGAAANPTPPNKTGGSFAKKGR